MSLFQIIPKPLNFKLMSEQKNQAVSQQNQAVSQQTERTIIVYCVVRYGQLVGCYENYEDACQMQRMSIEKGQICDLIPKPLLKSFKLY